MRGSAWRALSDHATSGPAELLVRQPWLGAPARPGAPGVPGGAAAPRASGPTTSAANPGVRWSTGAVGAGADTPAPTDPGGSSRPGPTAGARSPMPVAGARSAMPVAGVRSLIARPGSGAAASGGTRGPAPPGGGPPVDPGAGGDVVSTRCVGVPGTPVTGGGAGSEERRVGKECRSRWSPHHYERNLQDRAGAPAPEPVGRGGHRDQAVGIQGRSKCERSEQIADPLASIDPPPADR